MDLLAKGSVFVIASGIAAYYMSKRSQGMKEKNKPKSFVRTALKDMPPMKNDLLLRAARGEVVERIPLDDTTS